MALEDWNVTKNKFKSQCIWYKRQGLHLHDLVAYQSTSDEVMSVCRSPLYGLNSSTTLVFLISNMSKNFRSSDVLNLSLLYRNIRSCFRFSLQFLWTRAVLPGGLDQAFDWIVHRLRSVLLN